MIPQFIELTEVSATGGGLVPAGKRVIGTAHVVSVGKGSRDTASVTLATGEKLNVKENYDQVITLLGIGKA